MNDRFKFRFWDKNNKVMHYNAEYISSGSSGNDWIIFKSDKQELEKDKVFNNPYFRQQFIIMQSTGLKDKNGKLIYEGDIVKFRYYDNKFYIGTIKYTNEDALFCLSYINENDRQDWDYVSKYRLEVIGNIYENKELLDERN